MTARDLLDQAAQLIDTHGWNRHAYVGPKGELCLLGSLAKAYDPSVGYDEGGFDYLAPWQSEECCDVDYPESELAHAIGALASAVSARLKSEELAILYGQLGVQCDPHAGIEGDALDRAIVSTFNDRQGMNKAGAIKALKTAADAAAGSEA